MPSVHGRRSRHDHEAWVVLVVVGLVVPGVTPLSAQGVSPSAVAPVAFSRGSGLLLDSQAVVAGQRITPPRPDRGDLRLSSSAQSAQPAEAKKKVGARSYGLRLRPR